VPPVLAEKIEKRLNALDKATSPEDMNLPGYRLRELTGDRRGEWSIRVSEYWRIVFRFRGGEPVAVDLFDYH